MKEKKSVFTQKGFAPVMLLLSVTGPVLFYAARATWIFINVTMKLDIFTYLILCLMVLNCFFLAFLSAARLYEFSFKGETLYKKKIYTVLTAISSAFAVVFFIAGIVSLVTAATAEASAEYFLYLKGSAFDAAFYVIVPSLVIFLPAMGSKAKKVITVTVLCFVLVTGICRFFPIVPYKITSEPLVVDNGTGYSVVFSTNSYGTGYIEYTYDGESYKVFDETEGRNDTETLIHSVSVPYEHIRNNSYRVGSTRVLEAYSYGSRLGKELKSEEYTFKYNDSDNQTYLVISDWHTMLDAAYKAIEYVGEYDAVLMLGDSTPGVDFEQEVVRNIVEFGGEITKGEMPVIFIRGNHETRGAYAGKLPDALGMNKFYFTAQNGPYSFVVLDSGEDKEDSHPEYGGLTDYGAHRKEMVQWLKGVSLSGDKVIALSHSWQVSDVERELSDAAWNELDRLGVRLVLSGHTHTCRFVGDGSDREKEAAAAHPDITAYMDGGKKGDDFIASKMTLSSEGIKLEAFDNYGSKVFDEVLDW